MTGMEHAIEQAARALYAHYLDGQALGDWPNDYTAWEDLPGASRDRFLAPADEVVSRLAEAGLLAPAPLREAITIPRPHVPHGPKHLTAEQSDAQYLREAAHGLDEHYKPFGSNVRATVVKLLNDAADAVDRAEGDGRANQ